MKFLPEFNFTQVFVDPWSSISLIHWNAQIVVMGILVCWACGIVGSFIVVRRMALMGDAISHGILPGLALSFIFGNSLGLGSMFLGACLAGLACNFCIELLHTRTPIKEDAAMGLVFTSFFAIGVTLISLQGEVHLDPECILYGEIGMVPLSESLYLFDVELGNRSLWMMGFVCCVVAIGTILFYEQLLVTSFDCTLANSLGIPARAIHMALMICLALSTVASLEAVGVILVVAMFVFPSVTASFFMRRLPYILVGTIPLGVLYSIGGFHLAHWLDCSIAASIAVVATALFVPACLFGPNGGIFWKIRLNWTKKSPHMEGL